MINFNEMPAHSRIWIYQCDRFFSDIEKQKINDAAIPFIDSWDYHGQKLSGSLEIFYNKFIVFTIDEQVAQVGGCSIDKSVGFIKQIENEFSVNFFDRTLVAYKEDGEIMQKKMHEFWALRKALRITEDTIVFNNLVKTKGEFDSSWEVPFKDSWHNDMW